MLLFALLAILLDSTVTVPKSHWTAIKTDVPLAGTTVDCSIQVENDESKVDVILVTRKDAERFHVGRSFHPLYQTGFQSSARFRFTVDQPGEYVLLLDNRLEARHDTKVALKVDLWNPAQVHPVTLSPQRRQVIIVSSILFFLGVVAFSARKITEI